MCMSRCLPVPGTFRVWKSVSDLLELKLERVASWTWVLSRTASGLSCWAITLVPAPNQVLAQYVFSSCLCSQPMHLWASPGFQTNNRGNFWQIRPVFPFSPMWFSILMLTWKKTFYVEKGRVSLSAPSFLCEITNNFSETIMYFIWS